MRLDEVVKNIRPVDRNIEKTAREKIDQKTKPIGSLGTLELLALKMSLIQHNLNPVIKNKNLFVFAGDHGIAEEGVSAYSQEVTKQMVLNFLSGGAAINVLCRHYGIDIQVIDIGVKSNFEKFNFSKSNMFIDKKVSYGTKNFLKEPAMMEKEAIKSLQNGIDVFYDSFNIKKIDIAAVGEMGIGNSTSASAIISAATGIPPEKTTGRGTGISDEKIKFKASVIQKALELHKPDKNDGFDILKKVGGFEIGGIAGAILASASLGIPVVIDGLISTAGGLIAFLINPAVKDYLFAGHKSVETGQTAALEFIGLKPIIDLNMRLGEGTGAVIAIDIIDASCRIMCEMASFRNAGVSTAINGDLKNSDPLK